MIAHVKTLPHLKKYALWREGLPPDGQIDLKSRTIIPMMLSQLLVGKAKHDRRSKKLSPRYSADLPFLLNARKVDSTRRCFLTAENTRGFNQLLMADMRQYLLLTVSHNYKLEITEADTIRWFMDAVDIYDDISFWALKKSLFRFRQRQQARKKPTFGDHFVHAEVA